MHHSQVLIVDDEPANLLALEVILQPLNCRVVRANSGREALRHLMHGNFAVVLLDLQMPTMDGIELAGLIRSRERSRSLPIIFVTASDPGQFSLEQAYAVGAVDYLTKPLNPVVLLSKVRFFVELHSKNMQLEAMQTALHAAQMRDSQEHTRMMLENAKDYAFISLDLEGNVTEWSGAAARITGWTAEEISGRNLALLFTPEDVSAGQPSRERDAALANGRVADRRWYLHQDGTRFFADGVMVAVKDVTGAAVGLAKIFSDATERIVSEIERERLLREAQVANARLDSVFQQAPAFMCTLRGPDHVFEMANERYYHVIDRDESILGLPARVVLPEAVTQGFIGLLDQVYQSGKSFVGDGVTIALRQSDGSLAERVLDFVYVALRDADNNVTGVLVHGVDMTERKRFQDAVRVMDARYSTLIASMDEGFCLIELIFDDAGQPCDYRFLEVNPVFSEQTGLPASALGKTARELVPDLDRQWFERYGRVATTGEAIRFVDEAKAMGRWFDVYATRLGEADSRTVALLFRDITDQRLADENLRSFAAELAESNRKKSEFLAVLAHELRNPLAPIRSGLEVIRLSSEKPASVLRIASMMDRQVNHMVHLIDDLLDVARITSGKVELKREVVDLKDAVGTALEACMPLINASRHKLNTVLPADNLPIYADPIRIAQVIGNLLTNAAKYTPEGGVIELAVVNSGDNVIITVKDNGVGIPPEALASVFDMFSQVSRNLRHAQGGLGIGLSIVKQLVELHGGTVEASSAGEGAGTTFTITLPLAHSDAALSANLRADDDTPAGPSAPVRALQLLVADDNVDAAIALASLLELRGHVVIVAHDGHAALEAAKHHNSDIVFLDIGMPGLTGHEVARALRRDESMCQAILVALTGWGAMEDRARTQEAGFDYHLTKPAHLSALDEILNSALAIRLSEGPH